MTLKQLSPAEIRKQMSDYLGGTGEESLCRLVCEIISNAVDQYLTGLATEVALEVEGLWFRVSNNGAYFCREQAKECLSRSASNPPSRLPPIQLRSSRLGIYPVNCFCSNFVVESEDNDGGWKLTYSEGELVSEESVDPPGRTLVTGVADNKLFTTHDIPEWRLRHLFFEGVHLYPGLAIAYQEERFYSEHGLADLAAFTAQTADNVCASVASGRRFSYDYSHDGISVTFACHGTASGDCKFFSWVNGAKTPDGSHVEGMKDAMYGLDWVPATALVHVVASEPRFREGVGSQLDMDEVREIVRDALLEPLQEYVLSLEEPPD